MQKQETENMVDIDTTGPGADIELPEEKLENEVETKEDSSSAPQESTDKTVEASSEKPEVDKTEQKEELETYSKDVQRRIAKLTKKWREAERQKDEALVYARSIKDERDSLNKKYSTLETTSLKVREEKLKSSLEAAKAKLAAARDAGDINIEFDAQQEIAKAGYEAARLQELKSMAESQPEQVIRPADVRIPQQPEQVVDPRAEDWAYKNTWFGKDKPMTYTAFDIHRTLVEEEGYDPKSDEYYAEIDKRIRLDFPHKFDRSNTNSTKPTQIVASAKRSVRPGRKTVRLTPSQVAIAKKLGVPLEEYAKQLKITEGV
jgi:hypothetical protein